MSLAQPGYWPALVLVIVGLAIGLGIAWPFSLPVWILLILAFWVFRQPSRAVRAEPLSVLSPIDGRVVVIDEAPDPFLNRPALRIGLRQSLWGPFIIYAPTEGRLQRLKGTKTIALLLRTDEGDELTLEVGRGRPLRYLHCNVSAGERMRQGGICGFAGFGRTFYLYLPKTTRAGVETGAITLAGQPLARLANHVE